MPTLETPSHDFYWKLCQQGNLADSDFKFLESLLETRRINVEEPIRTTALNSLDLIAIRFYLADDEGQKKSLANLLKLACHNKKMTAEEFDDRIKLSISKVLLRLLCDQEKRATLHFIDQNILAEILLKFSQEHKIVGNFAAPLTAAIKGSFGKEDGGQVKIILSKLYGHFAAYVLDGRDLYYVDYNFPFGGMDTSKVGNGVVKFRIKDGVAEETVLQQLDSITNTHQLYPCHLNDKRSPLCDIVYCTPSGLPDYEEALKTHNVEGARCLIEGHRILAEFLLHQYFRPARREESQMETEKFFSDIVRRSHETALELREDSNSTQQAAAREIAARADLGLRAVKPKPPITTPTVAGRRKDYDYELWTLPEREGEEDLYRSTSTSPTLDATPAATASTSHREFWTIPHPAEDARNATSPDAAARTRVDHKEAWVPMHYRTDRTEIKVPSSVILPEDPATQLKATALRLNAKTLLKRISDILGPNSPRRDYKRFSTGTSLEKTIATALPELANIGNRSELNRGKEFNLDESDVAEIKRVLGRKFPSHRHAIHNISLETFAGEGKGPTR